MSVIENATRAPMRSSSAVTRLTTRKKTASVTDIGSGMRTQLTARAQAKVSMMQVRGDAHCVQEWGCRQFRKEDTGGHSDSLCGSLHNVRISTHSRSGPVDISAPMYLRAERRAHVVLTAAARGHCGQHF